MKRPVPLRLDACWIAAEIRGGQLKAEAVVEECLTRIAAREAKLHAWVRVDEVGARTQARAVDRGEVRGLLAGVPLAVKDIMDTGALPTEYGSPIYRGHRPKADAACVALARAAGAVIIGKTVTTEFANLTPGPTTNPHNPAHTPGGSSSGSAAAVADGQVPLAFGTQTAGSVIRPASFCGVAALKPSFNRHPVAGVKPVSQSLDTIGWFGRSVDDLALMRAALLGEGFTPAERHPRIGLCRTPEWRHAAPETVEAVEAAAANLASAGADLREIELPALFATLAEAQTTIMFYEAHRALAWERTLHGDRLSPALRERLEMGGQTSIEDYEEAQLRAAAGRVALDEIFEGIDVLLAPSAPGEAPEGLTSTGDPIMNRIWTLLGMPCVNLPGHRGPRGLPVGVTFVGPIGADKSLLAHAKWAETRLG
jgi:Asp-tRNA(Asn)/Glu-tRNA(Gln) amidotransferase A subunit family amidase